MRPCYAITRSHLGLLWDRKSFQVRRLEWYTFLGNFCKIVFDCKNFIAALFCQRGGSILPQTHQDKEETGCVFFAGYCCFSFCPTGWMAITADFLSSMEPGPLRVPWPCSIQRGETGAVKTHTSLRSPVGSAPPAAAPRGPMHTPANQLHLISWKELAPSGSRPPFSPLLPSAPLKSCVSVSLWLERVR